MEVILQMYFKDLNWNLLIYDLNSLIFILDCVRFSIVVWKIPSKFSAVQKNK